MFLRLLLFFVLFWFIYRLVKGVAKALLRRPEEPKRHPRSRDSRAGGNESIEGGEVIDVDYTESTKDKEDSR
jgi:hypothetical protein